MANALVAHVTCADDIVRDKCEGKKKSSNITVLMKYFLIVLNKVLKDMGWPSGTEERGPEC